MDVFGNYAYYYDSFYKDKDYAQEAGIVSSILQKYVSDNVVKLLNLGCGTGRHDIELCKLGYRVHGIDLSHAMIDMAKKQAESFNFRECLSFEVGNICAYDTQNKYDGVISLFHVISYQVDNDNLLAAFRTASGVLNSGGIFLFDAWYGPGVLSEKPGVRVKQIEDGQNILIRYANPVMHAQKDTVDVNYDILIIDKMTNITKELKETHVMRYLFTPQVASLLDMAGFDLIDCIDCNTLDVADYSSWTAYFVAKKR